MGPIFHLDLMPARYAIHRLDRDATLPGRLPTRDVFSITTTPTETTLVCEASLPVAGATHSDRPWRMLQVRGPFDFGVVGVLAALSAPLAAGGVSIYVVSTFDTDLILVREENIEAAVRALRDAGHLVY